MIRLSGAEAICSSTEHENAIFVTRSQHVFLQNKYINSRQHSQLSLPQIGRLFVSMQICHLNHGE